MTPKSLMVSFALGHWLPAPFRRGIIYDLEAPKKICIGMCRASHAFQHRKVRCGVPYSAPSFERGARLTDMYICSSVLSGACGERRVVEIQAQVTVASGSDEAHAGR